MLDAPLVCLIEDEKDLAQLVSDYLTASHYRIEIFHDGAQADQWLASHQPDLILLDLMLPGMDGLQIYRNQQARNSVPIIMMTAKVEEIDRLLGLELGADDYVCKPFSPRELVARVKAVLRRSTLAKKLGQGSSPEVLDEVVLQAESLQVALRGECIELTAIEFKLFELLYSQPGRIFSRQYIMDNIYQDYRVVSDRTVDSHIKKLRKKLLSPEGGQDLIRSVYGSGYKYEAS